MISISSDLVEEAMEIFMDHFSFYGSNFEHCLHCNTPKYTLAVFDMFRVFCKHNLNVS